MRSPRSGGWLRPLTTHPSAVLLFVQLLGVLVYPFMGESGLGRGSFEVFGALVLGLAIWSVRDSPGPTWIAVILGVVGSALASRTPPTTTWPCRPSPAASMPSSTSGPPAA